MKPASARPLRPAPLVAVVDRDAIAAADGAGTASPALAAVGAGLRAARWRQWWHFVVLPLAAWRADAPAAADASRWLLALVTAATLLAWAYGVNAFADRAGDLPGAKNPLAGAPTSAGTLVVIAAFGVASLALALGLGGVAGWAAALSAGCATVYSVGPRWKARPGVGTALNVGIFGPLLLLGPQLRPDARLGVLAVVFAALLVQNQLLHELADAAEDRASAVFTSAQRLGAAGTRTAALALAAVATALAWWLAPTTAQAGAAALALAAGAATVAGGAGEPAVARVRHRWVAAAAGAALWAAGAWPWP